MSTSTPLAQRHCRELPAGTPALSDADRRALLEQVPGWSVDGERLRRDYSFPDFVTALDFVNRVGAVAEEEGHHPDLQLGYGRVGVELWTHSVGGLSENDFILAARVNALPAGR
jgi:4a-hydroxytetrahydrobiopterin dehydratase